MDFDEDETESKKKKLPRYQYSFTNLCTLMIIITFFFILVTFTYHLIVILLEFSGFDSISEIVGLQNQELTPYEQFVHQVISNKQDPTSRFRGTGTTGSDHGLIPYPFQTKKDHFQETSNRILQRYQYLQMNRPNLIPIPPEEHQLPWDNLYDVVARWNPDNPEVPSNFQERFQHFNYGDPYERSLAEAYRNAEIPFKLYNVSEFNEVALKWNEEYLLTHIPKMRSSGHTEKSKDNHFMFWAIKGGNAKPKHYTPPTEIISDLKFRDYLQLTKQADQEKWNSSQPHYYFMLGVPPHDERWFIGKDLPIFTSRKKNFFISNPTANKGIQCRFGMRGVIAESHYDSGRNMVAMLHGQKRYIITPPWSCGNLGIIADHKHPSYRHSIIDWSDLAQAKANNFQKVDAIDTVLHVGEVLYIPSFWFHYIVSLEYSIQCNSRSGFPEGRKGQKYIDQCFNKIR